MHCHDDPDHIKDAVRRAASIELGYLVAVIALFFALAAVVVPKLLPTPKHKTEDGKRP